MNNHFVGAVISLLIILLVASCKPVYKTDYYYAPPPTEQGKLCANNCLERASICASRCKLESDQCELERDAGEERAYARYIKSRIKKDMPITKKRRDFDSYGGCGSATCKKRCTNRLNMCHTNCGGHITETQRCTWFCDQAP